MSGSKLQDRDEFIRWYQEGKTYSWIVEEYLRKYNIEIGAGTVSNWRHQLGLEKRQVRDANLIPWTVEREHRQSHLLNMLRAEVRRRAGEPVAPSVERKLAGWLRNMAADDTVVHYDPETEQGWFLVPRRPGVDLDLIREPDAVTRVRGSRDVAG